MYNVGDHVSYKIPVKYGQNSIEYRYEDGTITKVLPKCKGYYILPNGYDTPIYVNARNVISRLP